MQGEQNQNPKNGWLESAWMLKHDGRSYLTDAADDREPHRPRMAWPGTGGHADGQIKNNDLSINLQTFSQAVYIFTSPAQMMKPIFCVMSAIVLFPTFSIFAGPGETDPSHTLWYDRPATSWLEAMPVGNGRMGAMIFGGVPGECIPFNDQTLWTGSNRTQTGADTPGSDGSMGDYQPFGDLMLDFPSEHGNAAGYRRELDLSTGVATTTYSAGGITFRREVFTSHPDNVLVVRLTADKPGSINFTARLRDAERPPLTPVATKAKENQLEFSGRFDAPAPSSKPDFRWNGMERRAILRVINEGGRIKESGADTLAVQDADAVTLLLAAATDYGPDPERGYRREPPASKMAGTLDAAAALGYVTLKSRHLADHQKLYRRVNLDLGRNENSGLPTDRRLAEYAGGSEDPSLEALLFHYGRYLLIASSRPGGLPANLQGLWNNNPKPPWYSGYTTNINVEMNYWPAETTNLAECAGPLFDWVDRLAIAQKLNPDPRLRTEKGWIIYSTNNPLGGNSGWAMHLPGSAWLSRHFYEAWAFSGDRDFLANRAYPHLKSLTEMWDARLVEDESGRLMTPDGWSPEHGPVRQPDGSIVLKEGDRTPQPGASYDQQIIWDLFTNFIEASTALGTDPELRARITKRREKLLGPQIGRWGQLQEWKEDVDDPHNQHRHLSHVFGVFPGRQITPEETPKFAEAAQTSMAARGDRATGWSRAWKIALWARLQEGSRAGDVVRSLLDFVPADKRAAGTLPNLFGSHPPFQMDSNFGYTGGVAEMLLQSHRAAADGRRELHLLPALSPSWQSGSVTGLRARGGFTIDLKWANGRLTSAQVVSAKGTPFRIRTGDKTSNHDLPAGGTLDYKP